MPPRQDVIGGGHVFVAVRLGCQALNSMHKYEFSVSCDQFSTGNQGSVRLEGNGTVVRRQAGESVYLICTRNCRAGLGDSRTR